jgi:alpha-1,3-mannosyltransferase
MKILAITPTYYPHIGGIEQVVYQLCRHSRAHGIAMDVAHVATQFKHPVQTVIDGVCVHQLPLHGHRLLGLAPGLGRIARDYDLLHVHDPQLTAITTNVRLFCGNLPAVLSTHGGFRHTATLSAFKALFEKTLLRPALGHYRAILASSPGDLTYFGQFSPRVVSCGNGIDMASFAVAPGGPPRPLTRWIYWGRLSRNKRVDLVIDYAAHARATGFPVDLLICGRDFEGLAEGLKAKVASLGLAEAIRFVPFLSQEELRAEIATRGVAVTATEHEGFGLSTVEALAAGLLVVCRDMAPLNHFITDANGLHLAFDQSERDRAQLTTFLSRAPAQVDAMRAAALTMAATYDWGRVIEGYLEQYRLALPRQARSGSLPHRAA